jgi:shikimate dehydrogenase
VAAIGAANYLTIENGRLIGHNNDGKGVVKAIEKLAPLKGQRVVMLGAGDTGRAMAVELDWAGASPTSPRSPAARSRAARWPPP